MTITHQRRNLRPATTQSSPRTSARSKGQSWRWERLKAPRPGRPLSVAILFLGLALSRCSGLAAQDVLTYHNDNSRTGQDLQEMVLTPANVNPSGFGKLFAIPVDGKVDAQPLYKSHVDIPGKGIHNVLFIATEHDSVYAFDADDGQELWHVSALMPGETPSDDRGCKQVTPEIGVTATPVIDRAAGPHGTIYFIAMSRSHSKHYFQRLHALDLTTGREELGGPVEIHASYPGTGDDSRDRKAYFDPAQYKERAALLLVGHRLITSWASHCDDRPYTGWIMAYDVRTLKQTSVLNITPNGSGGAFWASGAGPAADSSGAIYLLAGNGTFDTRLSRSGFPVSGDFGNAFLKVMNAGGVLKVEDYFNMMNTMSETNIDMDLGSGGALLLPGMKDARGRMVRLAVGAGKDQNIYVVSRDHMGKYHPHQNAIYQELYHALGSGEFGMPAYFNGWLYYGAMLDVIRAFRFSHARLLPKPVSVTKHQFTYPGATPSISADGTRNAILWAVENNNFGNELLFAYDAKDLARLLYSSDMAPRGRDQFSAGNKFIVPTIANGKVYVGASDTIGVFGLLPRR